MRGKCCVFILYTSGIQASPVALFPQTRNFTPLCLSSPRSINGYRRHTAGVTLLWTSIPSRGEQKYSWAFIMLRKLPVKAPAVRPCGPLAVCAFTYLRFFYLFSSTIINSIPGKIWTSLRPAPSYKQSIWRGIQYGKTRLTGGKLNFICQMLHRQMPHYVAKKSQAPIYYDGPSWISRKSRRESPVVFIQSRFDTSLFSRGVNSFTNWA